MSDFYTSEKLKNGSCWQATEVTGGAKLSPLQPPADGLAKVRFSKSVFEILRSKKKPEETIRATLERIILEAP